MDGCCDLGVGRVSFRDMEEDPVLELTQEDLEIERVGEAIHESPLSAESKGPQRVRHFTDDRAGVIFEVDVRQMREHLAAGREVLSIERAGPRRRLFVDPYEAGVAVVTCGGLCPGLNNVIRSITLEAHYRYGVKRIYGIRYGFQGFIPEFGHEPMMLNPDTVANIGSHGGTVLASSRGRQEESRMVDWLVANRVQILFVIGGDGSQRGAMAINAEARRRGVELAVIGVPKTIDNDMVFLDKSFGFETAFSQAVDAIACAHAEAKGAPNGIGLVKLMGRHSGFIACHAALARNDVNFVLIPEVPFHLHGEAGFLGALEKRLKRRGHAVIVVAEGAGQDLMTGPGGVDASGNARLGDIGIFLRDTIVDHFKRTGIEANLKYIDPSYLIRAVKADPQDALYCARLGQNAVHAGLAGRTGTVVGRWHYQYVHLPMSLVTRERRHVEPHGDLWQCVLATTGQPVSMLAE